MIRKLFSLQTLFVLIILLVIFTAGCVSGSNTVKAEETPTPRPTPTEEPTTPEPTPELTAAPELSAAPTPRPTAPPKNPGSAWMTPEEINTTVNQKFDTEIHVNTGSMKIAAYGFNVAYDKNVLALDASKGTNGCEAGAQGFVSAINANSPGTIVIAGFDPFGKEPGTNLSLVKIHWIAKAKGSSDIVITVKNVNDGAGAGIGKSEGFGSFVNVK